MNIRPFGIFSGSAARRACLALGLAAALTGCAALTKGVEAAPYLHLQYSGYNGEGQAAVLLDEAGLRDALYKAQGLTATPEDGSAEYGAVTAAVNALQAWATPESALSNGDTVSVGGAVDAAALAGTGLSLTFTPFTDTVAGLDATRPVDPFSNLATAWDGYAPEITLLTSQANTTDAPWTWISYTADHNTALRPGDTVTLTASADAATLERLGFALTRTAMTLTVPDTLGNYLMDWRYLDAAGQSALKSKAALETSLLGLNLPSGIALKQAGADVATLGESDLQTSAFALDSAYLLTAQNGARPADGPGWLNALVCVYRFSVSSGDGAFLTAYGAFALPDIALTGTGLPVQDAGAVVYRTAELDRASLPLLPEGGAYTLTPVAFDLAATLETAAGASSAAPAATQAP